MTNCEVLQWKKLREVEERCSGMEGMNFVKDSFSARFHDFQGDKKNYLFMNPVSDSLQGVNSYPHEIQIGIIDHQHHLD
ncbi:hypothetical protein TNCV_86501 [Trichonephila clavipes]|nr:hypothetical protein TNCV_86501 [Trichonephila clavipes]